MEPSKVQTNYRFLWLVKKLAMTNAHKLLHQVWSLIGVVWLILQHSKQCNWNLSLLLSRLVNRRDWLSEDAGSTHPASQVVPTGQAVPTHLHTWAPDTTHHCPSQPDTTHQRPNARFVFINVFIQMHTNVAEQTQPQMYNATVLILEARDQKDEQLLSEYWNFPQLLMVWGGVNHWKYVRQIFQMQFCIGTYNLPNL